MPRIISRYSERPPSCHAQPDGQTMPSGQMPNVKVRPTSSRAMRRYLMRSVSDMTFFSLLLFTLFRCLRSYLDERKQLPLPLRLHTYQLGGIARGPGLLQQERRVGFFLVLL